MRGISLRPIFSLLLCVLLFGSILPSSLIAAPLAHGTSSGKTLSSSLDALAVKSSTQATNNSVLIADESYQTNATSSADAGPVENEILRFVVEELTNPPGVDAALGYLNEFHTALEKIENFLKAGNEDLLGPTIEEANASLSAFENAVPEMLKSLENEFSGEYVVGFNTWLENFLGAANGLLEYLQGTSIEASEALPLIANVRQVLLELPTGEHSVYFVEEGAWFEDPYGNWLPREDTYTFVTYPREKVVWKFKIFNDELRWPFWDPPRATIDLKITMWDFSTSRPDYPTWTFLPFEIGARTILTVYGEFTAPFEPANYGFLIEFDWQSTSGASGSEGFGIILRVKNRNPTASRQPVRPENGPWGTTFRFWTEYRDPDGHPPAYVRVYIDGLPFGMIFVSGDYKTKAIYEYWWQTASQDIGAHTYYFETWDGYGEIYRSATDSGPSVTKRNSILRYPTTSLTRECNFLGWGWGGSLTDSETGEYLAGRTVKLYKSDGTYLAATTTDSTYGMFIFAARDYGLPNLAPGTYYYYAAWDGDDLYAGAKSETVTLILTE